MCAPAMDSEEELQRQMEEAIKRSLEQTKLTEDEIMQAAIAASLKTQDEEVAREMQQEQYDKFEAEVCANPLPRSTPLEWAVVAGATRTRARPRPAANPHPTASIERVGHTGAVKDCAPKASSANGQSVGNGRAPEHSASPLGRPRERQAVANQTVQNVSSRGSGSVWDRHIPQAQNSHPEQASRRLFGTPPESTAVQGAHNTSHASAPSSALVQHGTTGPEGNNHVGPSKSVAQRSPSRRARASLPPDPQVRSPPSSSLPGPATTSSPATASEKEERKVKVVVDGQNVGCEYGGERYGFIARGVEIVLDFYEQKGVRAIAILPKRKVDSRNTSNPHLADDPELLRRLADQGRIYFTPAGAHDDHFILNYAMQAEADVISNDLFRKELDMQETVQAARALRIFLDHHLVPYTFVVGEFVPNPNPMRIGETLHQSRAPRY